MEGPTHLDGLSPPPPPPPPPSPDCSIVFERHLGEPPAGRVWRACAVAAAALRMEFVLAAFAFWIAGSPAEFTKVLQQSLNHWAEASSISRVHVITTSPRPPRQTLSLLTTVEAFQALILLLVDVRALIKVMTDETVRMCLSRLSYSSQKVLNRVQLLHKVVWQNQSTKAFKVIALMSNSSQQLLS